uniref:Uncharacterized protein n=1 Tax=Anguilla anguilla TaxID=7936 RepID=A0A0E9QY60_ANGAN
MYCSTLKTHCLPICAVNFFKYPYLSLNVSLQLIYSTDDHIN